jgi:hypothetical protein
MITVRVDSHGFPEAVRELRIAGTRLPAALRKGVRNAAAPVADAIRDEAAAVSTRTGRIPAAVQIRASVRNVIVRIDPKKAPEAAPINNKDHSGQFRHPVWAKPWQTRDQWTWRPQQANPFFLRGARRGQAEADRRLGQVFTEWERQAGFH